MQYKIGDGIGCGARGQRDVIDDGARAIRLHGQGQMSARKLEGGSRVHGQGQDSVLRPARPAVNVCARARRSTGGAPWKVGG